MSHFIPQTALVTHLLSVSGDCGSIISWDDLGRMYQTGLVFIHNRYHNPYTDQFSGEAWFRYTQSLENLIEDPETGPRQIRELKEYLYDAAKVEAVQKKVDLWYSVDSAVADKLQELNEVILRASDYGNIAWWGTDTPPGEHLLVRLLTL